MSLILASPIVKIGCHWGQSKVLDSNILEGKAFDIVYVDISTRVIMKISLGF